MRCTLSRRTMLRLGICGTLAATAPGCGTIFFPDRIGQPRSGPLDWKVVALDTLGLMLFVVPGVIAFAVDFYNGAIHLPPDEYGQHAAKRPRPEDFETVIVTDQELNQANIEQIVSQHSGQKVQLAPGKFRYRPFAKLQEFWKTHDELATA